MLRDNGGPVEFGVHVQRAERVRVKNMSECEVRK